MKHRQTSQRMDLGFKPELHCSGESLQLVLTCCPNTPGLTARQPKPYVHGECVWMDMNISSYDSVHPYPPAWCWCCRRLVVVAGAGPFYHLERNVEEGFGKEPQNSKGTKQQMITSTLFCISSFSLWILGLPFPALYGDSRYGVISSEVVENKIWWFSINSLSLIILLLIFTCAFIGQH